MHPEQILDMQIDLLNRLQFKPGMKALVGSAMSAAIPGGVMAGHKSGEYTGNLGSSMNNLPLRDYETFEPDDTGKLGYEVLVNHVKAAYAFRVTPDMCDVVVGMAEQFDEDEIHDTSQRPTGCGIVRFDKALPVHDVRGMTMDAHWLIWGPVKMVDKHKNMLDGVGCFWWNDMDQPDELALQLMHDRPEKYAVARDIMGRWAWIGFNVVEDNRPLGPMMVSIFDDYEQDVIAAHYPEFVDGSQRASDTTNSSRYVHALWTLLNQTITEVEETDVSRAHKKRARKMNIPGRVSVIKMRRTENRNQGDGESHVEWSHRWVVRGHLAWRRCGPDKPGAVPYEGGWRRRIWIPAYWKGPEDAPIMITDKIYDLSR